MHSKGIPMKVNTARRLLALFAVFIGVVVCARGQNGPPRNFVVLNDWVASGDNIGSVFALQSLTNPILTMTEKLHTGGMPGGGTNYMQEVIVLQHGGNVCIYVGDSLTADVAAFIYPGFSRVGRYQLPKIRYSGGSLGLAARGNFLFASYANKNNRDYIATWNIENGCSLSVAKTQSVPGVVTGMAISPDGKTLVVGYASPLPSIDSFSVGSDGTLTEHGPSVGPFAVPLGLDITADSKYALLGEDNGSPTNFLQVGIYAINSDGSLGSYNTFNNLGTLAINANFLWLSPDERFLYVSGDGGPIAAVTTLNFDESVPQVTLTGCSVQLGRYGSGLATAWPTGSGELLYQGLFDTKKMASVALYQINSSTGCLTEVHGSPFSSGREGAAASVAAWPPRPF
jgi:6-phosphogluconolactonase (cycloisomerase 2 family)